MPDDNLLAGLIGAGVMLLLGAIPFFVGWGSAHATIDALKTRMSGVEGQIATIGEIKESLAYIRGKLDQVVPTPPARTRRGAP
ncbi:MAG TPA: hypothetical protein VGH15_09625 [Caulobacteraceae bacterium]